MRMISKEALETLRERFPRGTRVELVQMMTSRHRPSVRRVPFAVWMTLAAFWFLGITVAV